MFLFAGFVPDAKLGGLLKTMERMEVKLNLDGYWGVFEPEAKAAEPVALFLWMRDAIEFAKSRGLNHGEVVIPVAHKVLDTN